MEYVYSKLVVPAFLFHNIVDHRRLNVVYFHNIEAYAGFDWSKIKTIFPHPKGELDLDFSRKPRVSHALYSIAHAEVVGRSVSVQWMVFSDALRMVRNVILVKHLWTINCRKIQCKSWYESIYLLNYITESPLWLKKRRIFGQNFCIVILK